MSDIFHATAVAWYSRGLIICGPSGAGKSDLALRLIERGAILVADDQVVVEAQPPGLCIRAPAALAGLIEVRGIGLVRMPYVANVRLALAVDLGEPGQVERLPDAATKTILGCALPRVILAGFERSAVTKLVAILRAHPEF